MKRTLLIGVAAGALLAGVNIASAQGMNEQQQQPRASGGAKIEQKGAVEQKGGGLETKGSAKGGAELKANEPGAKARAQAPDTKAQSDTKAQPEMKAQEQQKGQAQKGQQAQEQQKGQAQDQMKGTTGQAQPQGQREGQRAQERQGDQQPQRAQERQGQGGMSGTAAQSGQAAGGKVTLSAEQKTKIRETVIRSSNAPRVTNVNFSLSVGTVVPRTVRLAPLPPLLVEYYPAWRSYEYIIVGEQIIIIEPGSYRIIAILDV